MGLHLNGFWGGRCEKTFVDVKVFNLRVPSNRSTNAKSIESMNCLRNIIMKLVSVKLNTVPYVCYCNEMGTVLPIFLPFEISNPMSTGI